MIDRSRPRGGRGGRGWWGPHLGHVRGKSHGTTPRSNSDSKWQSFLTFDTSHLCQFRDPAGNAVIGT
jgi:hypothetical protein